MASIPFSSILMFVASAIFQLIGVILLPPSKGYTVLLPTVLSACAFLVGIFLLARIVASGVNIGTLIPLSAAFVPLCAIIAGVYLYGEPISWARGAMLVTACGLVAIASAA